MNQPNSESKPVESTLPPQDLESAITYENVVVTKAKLRKLKAEQTAAPKKAAFGRYKAWLHYANLRSWQLQGHHFNYLSGADQKHCTCGLVVNTKQVIDEVAPFVGEEILGKIGGIRLDDAQKMRGHIHLPTLKGPSVAMIVNFEWSEDEKKEFWTAICQQCGEFTLRVENLEASSFVKTHNKICGQIDSYPENCGEIEEEIEIPCPVCNGQKVIDRSDIGNDYYQCIKCEARFKA